MGNYPSWTRTTVFASTYLSVARISNFMMQLSSMQADFRGVMVSGGFSSLASFIHTKQSPLDGGLLSMFHVSLIAVTADQHHVKIHATKHLAGMSDAIQLAATTVRRGLETTTQFKRVNTFEASSTRNLFRASSYVGNGTSQLINLGYTPQIFRTMEVGTQGSYFEFIRRSNKVIAHRVAITVAHARITTSTIFVSNASGIRVKGSANANTIKYYYWAEANFLA